MSHPSFTFAGAKLLIAEDDVILRTTCAELLQGAGYRVLQAADGIEALELWEREDPALILLDLEMPRLNGWLVLEKLQLRGNRQPVILLTGRTDIADRVKGLAAGAVDYVCKPCDPRELIARVQTHLRHNQPAGTGLTILRFGSLTVDLREHTATSPAGPVALTRTEYAMLELLARHHRRPVTREVILDAVWGYTNRPQTRTVETHMWRLRGKLGDQGGEPRWIRTIPGAGYQLDCETEPAKRPHAAA